MSRDSRDGYKAQFITVLGSGHAPFASGSWGSLTSCVLFAALWALVGQVGGGDRVLWGLTWLGVFGACVLSVKWGPWAVQRYGSKDPKPFVLDEFAGQWIALLYIPLGTQTHWVALVWIVGVQFVLFRIFDVLKPPPAAQLERLPDGWGILLDDLFAGLYANLAGQALWRWTALPAWLGISLQA